MATKTTKRETVFAYWLLKYLNANMNNRYLVTAVVAWLRQEVGYNLRFMYHRNNPLNIRNSPFQDGRAGGFSTFSSLRVGAKAAARLLLGAGRDWRRYDRIVKAAQYVPDAKEKYGEQQQALSFLEAIALSAWDVSHYGLGKKHRTVATYKEEANHLVDRWKEINGVASITIKPPAPSKAKIAAEAKKHMAPPPLPPPTLVDRYIRPATVAGFYAASRPKTDLGNL